ncbi:hypothetical protein E2C01_083227 [Portunus trituberculatus]|uniref:Uncharacterized protein n=1 Tax=Portunus trituberculatus TaxID=210409 RepID=A0A5B7J2W8_PORTR|nr:hypothetical protein [Portunus trituberculatus]
MTKITDHFFLQPATQQEEEEKEKEKEEEGETNNTKKERVFPSLHDTYLRTAGLLRDDPAFTSPLKAPVVSLLGFILCKR